MQPIFIIIWVLTSIALFFYLTRVAIRIQSKNLGYLSLPPLPVIFDCADRNKAGWFIFGHWRTDPRGDVYRWDSHHRMGQKFRWCRSTRRFGLSYRKCTKIDSVLVFHIGDLYFLSRMQFYQKKLINSGLLNLGSHGSCVDSRITWSNLGNFGIFCSDILSHRLFVSSSSFGLLVLQTTLSPKH